jgi:hypothetical protein
MSHFILGLVGNKNTLPTLLNCQKWWATTKELTTIKPPLTEID